jgi:predicted dehydrogenase
VARLAECCDDIKAALELSPGVKIMVLDACRNNPLADRFVRSVSLTTRDIPTVPLALHVTMHDVDLVLWMLEGQEPVSVYAPQTAKLLGPIGTQDTIAALVRFSGGTLVNFESAWSLPGGVRHMIDARLELLGTEGPVEVQCGDSGLYFADNQTSREIDTQHWPSHGDWIGGYLRLQLASVVRWLDGDFSPVATGEDALRSLALTCAVIRSAESGELVRL